MLRFILEGYFVDLNAGTSIVRYLTIDADVPEVERALSRGGSGPGGSECWTLRGVEVIEPAAMPTASGAFGTE